MATFSAVSDAQHGTPQIICSCLQVHWTSCPPLTLVAVTIDLYDPSCSHASLQNQSSSSRNARSGFVHDRWNPGTSTEIAAALHHNHLSLWNEKMTRGDWWDKIIVATSLKLNVALLRSVLIWIILYWIAKHTCFYCKSFKVLYVL